MTATPEKCVTAVDPLEPDVVGPEPATTADQSTVDHQRRRYRITLLLGREHDRVDRGPTHRRSGRARVVVLDDGVPGPVTFPGPPDTVRWTPSSPGPGGTPAIGRPGLLPTPRRDGVEAPRRPVEPGPPRSGPPGSGRHRRPWSAAGLLHRWTTGLRIGPLGRLTGRLLHPRDPVFALVIVAASVLSTVAYAHFAALGATLAYPDAVSHLLIARRVLDSPTPGAAQLGGVLPPLPHLLALPLVGVDPWFRSGFAGSAVSMCAYVAATGWLYRIGAELTGRRVAGVTAALVFAANPNVLYLQSTPMTEPLLFACVAGATWYLLRWYRDGDHHDLAGAAVAVLAATLTRYEGWAFLVAVAAVVGCRSWWRARRLREAEPWVRVRAELVLFGLPAACGVVGWLGWNTKLFGDPLHFHRGEYARSPLWTDAAEPAVGDWGTALRAYLHAVVHDTGTAPLVPAAAGVVCLAWRAHRRAGAGALLPLGVFLPFFLCVLVTGQRPLHVPELGGEFYNVRFGLVVLLPVAVLTGCLVLAADRLRPARALPALLVPAACAHLAVGGVATLEEARGFRAEAHERANAAVGAWLRDNYDHGRVLMQSFGNETSGFDSRIPLDRVVYEGSFRQWESALADPVAQDVRWIHLRRTPGTEDRVWRSLHDSPLLRGRYRLAYSDPDHVVYRWNDLVPPGGRP